MGTETVSKIPAVDLSMENLKPGTSSWLSACNEIRQALEEYGCFEVVYSNPSMEFHNAVLAALEESFQLPQEIKLKNVNPSKPSRGYVGQITAFPNHEAFGIEYANNRDECLKFTTLMWPQGNDHFCETVHSYAKMVAELEELLVRMLFESYGLEKHIDSHIKSTTYLLRFLKYKRSEKQNALGFYGHTDMTFLSILHQNHVNGLTLRTKDGEFITYNPSSHSSFAVTAGDLCMAWSNNRIKSCYHRVRIDSEEVRYAVGLFSFLSGLIKAPEELVDDEHPLEYKPFEFEGLFDFLMSSNRSDKGASNMVKAYCGV